MKLMHPAPVAGTTPAGKAMFQMMGVFAEFERAMIAERVRAGLARARGEGKRLGRPLIAPATSRACRRHDTCREVRRGTQHRARISLGALRLQCISQASG